MKSKKKYIKAYRNLIKSYIAICLLTIASFLIIFKLFDGIIKKDYNLLINNAVAIGIGVITSILLSVFISVKKDSKHYLSNIEQNNEILLKGLQNLELISKMILFTVESKKNEIELLVLYKDVQQNRNLLANNDLFDNISLVGINSLYDSLNSSLLRISNKKDFIDESPNLISTIDNITKMIEEVITLNNDEKDAFLKEKERLDNLFTEKKKS